MAHSESAHPDNPRVCIDGVPGGGHGVEGERCARLMLHVLGLVNPIVRELKEVLHEFDEPFIVDHSKFADKFGVEATPHEESIRTTLEWYRANPRA